MAGRVLDGGDQGSAGLIRRSNAEWIAALDGTGAAQAAALIDLQTHRCGAAGWTRSAAVR